MNDKRIAIGLTAWFLGVIVPIYHHIALHAAIAGQPFNNDIQRMQWVWEFLPWLDWLYLIVMWLVGLILMISGMLAGRRRVERQWKQAGPRGFEVTPVGKENLNQ